MMCQIIGWGPIGTMALGRNSVSSRSRVPFPPQRMTTFIMRPSFWLWIQSGRSLGARFRHQGFDVAFGVVIPDDALAPQEFLAQFEHERSIVKLVHVF